MPWTEGCRGPCISDPTETRSPGSRPTTTDSGGSQFRVGAESRRPGAHLDAIESVQLAESDVISFHDYNWPEKFAARVAQLAQYQRPIICTEYMARGAGSTLDTVLPQGKQANVGMINWGFVVGKTQTNLPWDSWQRPYTLQQPAVWHHDLLLQDGTPYRAREVEILRSLSKLPKGQIAAMP